MGLQLSGLASGMDTDTVIQQLMAIDQQGKTRLQGQQWAAQAKQSGLDQVATQLRTFKLAVDDLRSVGTWGNSQSVDTTDSSKLTAVYKSGAAPGSYNIDVQQLARADQRYYDVNAATTTGRTITVGYNGDATSNVTYNIADGASLNDIAAQINGDAKATAFASIVNNQLVLSGKKTGVDLTVTSNAFNEDTTPGKRRASQPALFTIDGGTQQSSATNTVTGAINGVDFTLKSLTSTSVTINVGPPGPDPKVVQAKTKAFVDAYNATIDLIKGKLSEEKVSKNPTTQDDYSKGVLHNDPGLQGILTSLRYAMSDVFKGDTTSTSTQNPTTYDQLSDIGISVPAAQTVGTITDDRLDGKLVIDTDKLTAALTADPTAVRRLFGGVGTISGVTQSLDGILDPVSKVATGTLAVQSSQAGQDVTRLAQQMLDMDSQLKLKEDRLRAQFTAMETALSQSQSMQSWLTGQINSLA